MRYPLTAMAAAMAILTVPAMAQAGIGIGGNATGSVGANTGNFGSRVGGMGDATVDRSKAGASTAANGELRRRHADASGSAGVTADRNGAGANANVGANAPNTSANANGAGNVSR